MKSMSWKEHRALILNILAVLLFIGYLVCATLLFRYCFGIKSRCQSIDSESECAEEPYVPIINL